MPPVTPPMLGEERYELGAHLGSGGMADVFAGYDRRLDRAVAVKLLKTDLPDPRARERFEHEARTAAGFVHPNAVTVYDVGATGDRPFLVMELVDGDDLATVLATRGPLAPHDATRIAGQMLAGLGAAHERGLVHRDVKPGNVLLARDGTAKLADFGIAKATADASGGLTLTGQVLGTPRYLAPEQAAGKRATPRSDLYSVGVVLYEMLAGTPPFTGDTPMALALAHQQAPVPPLTERRPGLPRPLVAATERALEKDPARRFTDADTMRAALHGAAPTEPATRTAVLPPLPRSRPSRRRHRKWWVAAALAALLVAGTALGLALFDRDGDRAPRAGGVATTPDSTQETTTTTTSAPPSTEPPAPQTIEELMALLAANPNEFGEKGPDLLDKLGEAAADPEEAAKLIEEIDKWLAEGQLDAEIGATARELLTPIAAAPEPDDDDAGQGRGNRGNGNGGRGQGNGDDD